jgi:hypothetical protein
MNDADDYDFPTRDPVAQWRSEGEALERQRRIAKRQLRMQERQQTRDAAAATTTAAVAAQLHEQKEFLIEVCGQALGQCAQELRDELSQKIAELEKHLKGVHDLYKRELDVANSHIELLQRQLNNVKRYGGRLALDGSDDLEEKLN